MLALVLVHGVFWSGLLTGSAAYMTNILPESRRAEGIAYWGLSTDRGHRGGAVDRLLGVSVRLARALPGDGGAQHR